MTFPTFCGNCKGNVNKDAKYHVRSGPEGAVIGIIYNTLDGERWYPSTDQHPELVRMVNAVKTDVGDAPNGSFYINEYKQIIVPVLRPVQYFYAGKYEQPLRFEFEGKVLSGEPHDLKGNPLSPGDEWVGPHPGIAYILGVRRGLDIRYTKQLRPNVEKDMLLSREIGTELAEKTINQLSATMGRSGGRFYVNEHRTMFTPIQERNDLRYVYVGQLDLDSWFPEPSHN